MPNFMKDLKRTMLALKKKIKKEEITWKQCAGGKARLLLLFKKTPESGSAT